MSTLYWWGFALAFLSYSADRARRAIRPEDGGDSLYLLVARTAVAAGNAAIWPGELLARIAFWGATRWWQKRVAGRSGA